MRISGGNARGIPLLVPGGDAVRPATDGLRQAVFSSLAARVPGTRFLDLFAGSGAYGLEALSRGAVGGVFVEAGHRAASCLRRNLAAVCKSLGRDESGLQILEADATAAPLGGGAVPDLVFIDPPYEQAERVAPALFARLAESLASRPDALVVFEVPAEIELSPPGWACLRRLGKKGGRQPNAAIFRRS
ncbi:MAG TPA: RsmD family RNA methyltransferase [Opitutaceae bacterium]|nr:RsmD family RNA methyltransferase [Opitutaceae bacterium]